VGDPGRGAFESQVRRLAREWAVPCDAAQTEALTRFATLLMTWTARINLTGATSIEVLANDHFPDSFALAARFPEAEHVVDVGSGGGLPAIPLALLRPGLRLRLVEPIAKKAAFLRTAVRELTLTGRVSVDGMRAEALVPTLTFDAAISRATLPPPEWVKLGVQLVRPGGRVFVLTSGPDEIPAPGLAPAHRFSYLDDRRWLHELHRPLAGPPST
jgi:16S rRNA (guanine527-N7)-methyltransferase